MLQSWHYGVTETGNGCSVEVLVVFFSLGLIVLAFWLAFLLEDRGPSDNSFQAGTSKQ